MYMFEKNTVNNDQRQNSCLFWFLFKDIEKDIDKEGSRKFTRAETEREREKSFVELKWREFQSFLERDGDESKAVQLGVGGWGEKVFVRSVGPTEILITFLKLL